MDIALRVRLEKLKVSHHVNQTLTFWNTPRMKLRLYLWGLVLFTNSIPAATYTLPTNGDTVIQKQAGDLTITAPQDETLLDVARQFLLGQEEIVRLNRNLDRW